MGRVNTPTLDETARAALEKGHRSGKKHAFRKRCQLVLLKAQGRCSAGVGEIIKLGPASVDNWVKRYQAEGIEGLVTKPGRGPKPKLDKDADSQAVLAAVKANRQRLSSAQTGFEAQGGKAVSRDTFRRFLKSLADATNA